ncbi:hypothetical protein ACOSQ3_027641 [Xanthoceras sorbifolium]
MIDLLLRSILLHFPNLTTSVYISLAPHNPIPIYRRLVVARPRLTVSSLHLAAAPYSGKATDREDLTKRRTAPDLRSEVRKLKTIGKFWVPIWIIAQLSKARA